MRLDIGQIEVMDAAMVEVYRSKTPAERIAICDQLWHFAQQITRAGIRQQHADWSHEQVEREAVRRLSHGVAGTAEGGRRAAGEAVAAPTASASRRRSRYGSRRSRASNPACS